jgi:GxxExxY protein
MRNDPSGLSHLTEQIIGSAIAVHRGTGPGLLESAYRRCLTSELLARGIPVAPECQLPLFYRGERLDAGYRLDLLVDNTVVVEVKAVPALLPVHHAQLITYLKLTGCPVGLLLNFNVASMRRGIRRLLHPSLRTSQAANCVPGGSG